jgi:multidrug efflux pump subunit AcrB
VSGTTGPAGRLAQAFIDSKLTPLIVAAALGLGLFAVVLTPREEEPQIVVPLVDLFVALPGVSPTEVENRVTIPLEKRMWEIPGVEYVYSVSMPGQAVVTVRFFVGEDMERSLVKLYDKLAGSLDRVPPGTTPPLVKLRTIDDVPVVALTLWSHGQDAYALHRMAAELARELARIDRVSDVRVTGGQRREVSVLLQGAALAARGLDPAAVAAALRAQNTALSAGSFELGNREVRVETGGFLHEPAAVEALVVGAHAGRPVYLRDVARVVDGPAELQSYVFFAPGPAAASKGIDWPPGTDGLVPAVTVSVAKRKGADAHRVVAEVLDRVDALRDDLIPSDVGVTVTRDYGETSNEKARELLTHLVGAIVSVTIVIALFLGWRGGLVVFLSVPVTFALTLFVYYVFGYTLNRVTLFALIFVTGIVVDDSIIVVENIVRHLSMRKLPPLQAAIAAVGEVGNPTILATLTVIAAVLPMAFVRGLMGPYMRPMPVGASLAMVFSLLIALIAAPWLAHRLLSRAPTEHHGPAGGHGTRSYRLFRALLAPLMIRPWRGAVALAVVFGLLLLSVLLFPLRRVTVKMLPFDNKSELQIIVDMPEGTTLETTTRVAQDVASFLQTVPEVTDLQIYAGAAAPVNFNGLVRHYDLRQRAHEADLQVNLVHKGERDERSHAIAKRLRPEIAALAERHGASIKIAEIPPGPPVTATLVSEIYGPSHERRLDLAREVRDIYASTPGVVDVDWIVEAPQPKEILRVDHEKAALHGLAAADVARALRLVLDGETGGTLHDPHEAEPVAIRLRFPRADRSSVEDLLGLQLVSRDGGLVPLSELVRRERTVEPVSLHRKNLQPVIYVTGDVAGTAESPVYAILDMAERIDVPQHYRDEPSSTRQPSVKWDGEWHITYEVFRDLGIAFGVVLILIYMLIIGWFRSFRVPLVMMIAIPLSLVGILPGHWMLGAFFTATSMIGFIALAGIMVRNSVLLIDFVDLALADGRRLGEAVVEAVAVRTRPILLTAGTVVVGALVILFDPIFEGLAISLMFGAAASTVLTLVVVPLVYFMIERRRHADALPAEWLARRTQEGAP